MLLNYIFQWERRTTLNSKRYQACDVELKQSDPQPNSWLLSDQITVSEANRIDITVKYLITSCSNFDKTGGHYCVNVFDLYVNQSNQSIADSSFYPDPRSNAGTYKRIAELKQTADRTTYETISVLAKEKHVILAFHNYGACSTLFSVKVTYNVCPDEILRGSLVTLPRTVAPANDSEPTRAQGECTNKEAVQVYGSLYVYCESNGEWNTTELEGRCVCKEDMQNNEGICEGILYYANISDVRCFQDVKLAEYVHCMHTCTHAYTHFIA